MAISLAKGQKVNLTKDNPGMTIALAGLHWDKNQYDSGADFDLDGQAWGLDANGKCVSEDTFVFYGHTQDAAGSVVHSGDNRTGDGEGDDEVITIKFASVPAAVQKIAVTITIHEAEARNQNFGQISNAGIHISNGDTSEQLYSYDLSEDFSIETAVVVGEFYRNGADWKFNPIGMGYSGGLKALCNSYGIDAE